MQDNKNESSAANLKLCFLILTCISEDQYANSMMHDSNLTYKVLLHRAPMRHRKLPQVSRSIEVTHESQQFERNNHSND